MPEEELTEEAIEQQVTQFNQQLDQIRHWATSQSADLIAKAELLRELDSYDIDLDELESVPAEPARMDELAQEILEVRKRVT